MIAIPTYLPFVLIIPVFWKLSQSKLLGWVGVPKNALVIIAVCSIIAIPIQVSLNSYVPAYEYGNVYFNGREWTGSIGPGGVYRLGRISNWHTRATIEVDLSSDSNVSMYFIDENIQGTKQAQTNGNGSLHLLLPYLYDGQGNVANWTLCIQNLNMTTIANFTLTSWWLEDSLFAARLWVVYLVNLPGFLVGVLWVSSSLGGLTSITRHPEAPSGKLVISTLIILTATGAAMAAVSQYWFFSGL